MPAILDSFVGHSSYQDQIIARLGFCSENEHLARCAAETLIGVGRSNFVLYPFAHDDRQPPNMSLFIDPNASFVCDANSIGETFNAVPLNGWGAMQLFFLTSVYGVVLYYASNLIAEGSDLLTLILNPGLVGGLLLPVMGAIPDGAIVLFSGLGPREIAQAQLSIGIGTLAGSTIMLLTVPWFIATYAGRVDLVGNPPVARYKVKQGQAKLTPGRDCRESGVAFSNEVRQASMMMLTTGCIYLVIQVPAFQYLHEKDDVIVAARENRWALVGLILSVLAFGVYSWYQVSSANAQEAQKKKILAYRLAAFQQRIVDLAFLVNEIHDIPIYHNMDTESFPLREESQVERILRHTFDKYDVDNSGELDPSEIRSMFASLNLHVDVRDLKALLLAMDSNNDGAISFEEYKDATISWLMANESVSSIGSRDPDSHRTRSMLSTLEKKFSRRLSVGSYGTMSPTEHEVPDFLDDYDEDDEQETSLTTRQIILVSGRKLLLGVLLVGVFSDPMCDVLSALSERIGIPNFYTSFFITPISANASELISAYYFGRKKTKASISLSYASLLGASTMNNTFCLSIFMGLIYFRELEWNFSAEVLGILFVQATMCILCLHNAISMSRATFILLLFPFSVFLIALLNYFGWK